MDRGGFLHLGRDEIERRSGKDENQRKDIQGDDKGQPPKAEDIHQRVFDAGQRRPYLVDPARVGAGQQDPPDCAQKRWHDERAQRAEVE